MPILPETLTTEQKLFLRRRYRLDVENTVRSRRRHRLQIMFLWVMPLLAFGLVVLDAPQGPLAERPTEIVVWSLSVFLLIAEPIVLLWLWLGTRKHPASSERLCFEWYVLFRDRIGRSSPAFVRWTHRICAIAIVAAAMVTGRPALAAAWVVAMSLGIARHVWEDRAVTGALDMFDRQQA